MSASLSFVLILPFKYFGQKRKAILSGKNMAAKYQNHYIENIQVQPFPFSDS